MPQISLPNGQIRYVPGVYNTTKIASALPGALPAFLVPVLLGSAFEGVPYNVDSLLQTSEVKPGPFSFHGTPDSIAEKFGRGSDVHRAAVWAWRHGLPGCYVATLSALTRASALVDASTVNQFTLYARSFGAVGNWVRVSFATNVLTVQKLKHYALLRANLSGTATRIELRGNTDWITVGGTYHLGDNATAIGTVTILRKSLEYDASGQPFTVVETVAAFGSAITTAAYALLGEYDTGGQEVFSGLTTGQAVIDAVNAGSQILVAHKHANFTNAVPDTVASLLPIKQLATWTPGTPAVSPAASSSDATAFVALMNSAAWEDFVLRTSTIPQAYLLAMGDTASHTTFRDYAIAERTRGYPISVTSGVRWGDTAISAGDATDPLFRTQALNSQDFSLWGPGLDYEAPFLSLASAVWARRISGGPGHNLTNDELLFSVLEDRWNEIGSGELSTLLRRGFGTVKLSTARTARYRVAQGASTLQANAVLWNPGSKDTWSLMARDLADFFNRGMAVDLEEDIIGADGVTPSLVAAMLRRRVEKFFEPNGYVQPDTYKITSILLNNEANGYNVAHAVKFPDVVDYVHLENTILIGS